ncbi:hypothetical protein [Mesorhizobium amorphae]
MTYDKRRASVRRFRMRAQDRRSQRGDALNSNITAFRARRPVAVLRKVETIARIRMDNKNVFIFLEIVFIA